jgi:rod shape-determining protein MreD
MIALFFATFGRAAVLGILQTNILQLFSMAGMFPIPDFSFIVLVYFAFTQGAMSGQLMGFASGILLDCLSLSPFGFNAFVRTACGHSIGRF